MKKLLSTACASIFFYCIQGQNLVPNASFETGPMTGIPLNLGHLDNWQNFGTSDPYRVGIYEGGINTATPSAPFMEPHTGLGYAGFGPCEGGQVKLTSTVKYNSILKVSFWWSPRHATDTEINIYLLKNKVTTLPDCFDPSSIPSHEFHALITVNAGGTDAVHIPGEWYYYESDEVMVVEEYEWLAFKGIFGDNGVFGSDKYVYVDDFSVVATEYCDYACTPVLGALDLRALPTSMWTNNPDIIFVQNATEVEFQVANQWGNLYNFFSFDPLGLKNVQVFDPPTGLYEDWYILRWQATDNNGNYLPLSDTYVYTIKAWNCSDFLEETRTITIFPNGPAQPQIFAESYNTTPPDCCIEIAKYQSYTFTGTTIREVDNYIWAGNDIIPFKSPGPVIVSNGAYVRFRAGEYVLLDPGFSVEAGADFEVTLDFDCAPGKRDEQDGVSYPIVSSLTIPTAQNLLTSSPNPFTTHATLYVELVDAAQVSLHILDLSGREVTTLAKEVWLEAGPHTYTLVGEDLAPGVYIASLDVGGIRQTLKLVRI